MKYTQHPLSAVLPSIDSKWDFLFDGQVWEGMRAPEAKIAVVRPLDGQPFWTFLGYDTKNGVSISTRRPCARWMIEAHLKELGIQHDDDWRGRVAPSVIVETNKAAGHSSVVYFVAAGKYLKIGFSVDVHARIESFRTGCPDEIELLATIPGGAKEERRLHKRFAHLHHRGEWFRFEGSLADYVASLNAEAA